MKCCRRRLFSVVCGLWSVVRGHSKFKDQPYGAGLLFLFF